MTDQWLNKIYDDYHSWKGWTLPRDSQNDVARAVADLKFADIPPPARLMELGFGDGAFLNHARSMGYACAGLERGSTPIEHLRERGIDARIGDIQQFASEKFDIIVAFDVFEHIPISELIETLTALESCLQNSGRMVARFPNMASPFGLVNQYGDITHITPLSPNSLAQLARLAGLEVVHVANAATGPGGGSMLRRAIKPVSVGFRKLVEAAVSFAFYGKLTPLAPSVVVILKKKS